MRARPPLPTLLLLLLALPLMAAACSGPHGASSAGAPSASSSDVLVDAAARPALDRHALERRIHARVNAVRREHDLPPLAWSEALAHVARGHSRDMARRGYFAHRSPGGRDATDRSARAGLICEAGALRFTSAPRRAATIGENLFVTSLYDSYRDIRRYRGDELIGTERLYRWKTPQHLSRQTVGGWMKSDGHRRNLLHAGYHVQGIGVAQAEDGTVYVTENLC